MFTPAFHVEEMRKARAVANIEGVDGGGGSGGDEDDDEVSVLKTRLISLMAKELELERLKLKLAEQSLKD